MGHRGEHFYQSKRPAEFTERTVTARHEEVKPEGLVGKRRQRKKLGGQTLTSSRRASPEAKMDSEEGRGKRD